MLTIFNDATLHWNSQEYSVKIYLVYTKTMHYGIPFNTHYWFCGFQYSCFAQDFQHASDKTSEDKHNIDEAQTMLQDMEKHITISKQDMEIRAQLTTLQHLLTKVNWVSTMVHMWHSTYLQATMSYFNSCCLICKLYRLISTHAVLVKYWGLIWLYRFSFVTLSSNRWQKYAHITSQYTPKCLGLHFFPLDTVLMSNVPKAQSTHWM